MSALLGVNVAARFLLELAAVLPLAAGVLWGSFVAPKARRRLPDPSRLGVEAAVFGAAVVGLLVTDRPGWGVLLAVLVVANEVLLFVWGQRAF